MRSRDRRCPWTVVISGLILASGILDGVVESEHGPARGAGLIHEG